MKRHTQVILALVLVAAMLTFGLPDAQAQGGSFVYVVQYGDTLSAIALRYGTSVSAIAALNGIYNPSRIYVGQRLAISSGGPYYPPTTPGRQVHVVQPGENLFRIGLLYGYDVYTMAAVNGLPNANRIYVGQRLLIPRNLYHTVRYGETVASIAWAYGSSVSAIANANGLWNPNLIYVGQVLRVP